MLIGSFTNIYKNKDLKFVSEIDEKNFETLNKNFQIQIILKYIRNLPTK